MKIAVYQNDLPSAVGGAARFEQQVTAALLGTRDSTHEFVTTSRHPRPEQSICAHVALFQRPVLSKWRDRYRRLRRQSLPPVTQPGVALREAGVDLIYSPSPWLPLTGVPFVLTCWDLQHRVQPYFPEVSIVGWTWDQREAHYRDLLPRATTTIVGTTVGRREVEQFYGVHSDRIAVVPFAAFSHLESVLPARPDWAPTVPFVIYPAQFWPHKNHATLIMAIAELKRRNVNIAVVCSGAPATSQAGTLGYMKQLAAETGIEDRCFFPGFIPDGELRWAYDHAVALAFPSLFGPDNLPPLEAFRLGCPVIASDIGGAREQLGNAALLLEPLDAVAFASGIESFAKDQALRNKYIEAGMALASQLTIEKYVSELLVVFDDLDVVFKCWRKSDVKVHSV